MPTPILPEIFVKPFNFQCFALEIQLFRLNENCIIRKCRFWFFRLYGAEFSFKVQERAVHKNVAPCPLGKALKINNKKSSFE